MKFFAVSKSMGSRRSKGNLKKSFIKLRNVKKSRVEPLVKTESKVDEIDALFDSLKTRKKAENVSLTHVTTEQKKKKQEPLVYSSKEEESSRGLIKSIYPKIISPEAPLHRVDKESGLPVYKAHLLKVGQGGGTPDCPFDCSCCF